jgi:hypothetical protein
LIVTFKVAVGLLLQLTRITEVSPNDKNGNQQGLIFLSKVIFLTKIFPNFKAELILNLIPYR